MRSHALLLGADFYPFAFGLTPLHDHRGKLIDSDATTPNVAKTIHGPKIITSTERAPFPANGSTVGVDRGFTPVKLPPAVPFQLFHRVEDSGTG